MPKDKDDKFYEKFVHPSEVAPPSPPVFAPRAPARNPGDPVYVPVVPGPKPGEPVKTGGTYTVFPDKAHDAAVFEAAVRKNDPPKYDAAVHTFQSLAHDIANLTSGGPGKVTQPQLDALHAKAQSILGKV